MKKYIPNILTVIRIVLAFFFVYIFFSNMENSQLYAAITFFVAGATDVLDGHIARKYKLISDFGKLMDPFADKLMQFMVSLAIAVRQSSLWWVPAFIFVKEITMIFASAKLYNKGVTVSANWAGKLATAIYFVVFFVIILYGNVIPILYKQLMCVLFVFFSGLAFAMYYVKYINNIKKSVDK